MGKVLKKGDSGAQVKKWQIFLRGQGFIVDTTGVFDDKTFNATVEFQRKYKLDADGIVGNQSLGKAAALGLELVTYSETETGFPPKPDFAPLVSTAERQKLFGPLKFESAPTADNPEAIRILGGWDKENIVKVTIPQLIGIKGASSQGTVYFHKKAEAQLRGLWQAWEKKGLLNLVLSYEGAYAPRFIRGGAPKQILSNHAFGTAFDINYAWNKLGAEPATENATGCVYKLVSVAHQFGFYWGGHFTRRDGMHFEVAKIL